MTPSKPKPTTAIPMTAPPENAISKALFIPSSRADVATRELLATAPRIPKYPAVADKVAPSTKVTAVPKLMAKAKTILRIKTNAAKMVYSLLKKAIAPSRM